MPYLLVTSNDPGVPGLSSCVRHLMKESPGAGSQASGYLKIIRDNPILDLLIEGGTKALRRGLMSGETLRAPRQQLRWDVPRPSTSFLNFPYSLNQLIGPRSSFA